MVVCLPENAFYQIASISHTICPSCSAFLNWMLLSTSPTLKFPQKRQKCRNKTFRFIATPFYIFTYFFISHAQTLSKAGLKE